MSTPTPQVPPATPLTATLAYDQWQRVLIALKRQPWEFANPLIEELLRQLLPQERAAATGLHPSACTDDVAINERVN